MDLSFGRVKRELEFSFGPFRLIPKRQLLLNGDRPVKLGGRAFELLRLLVQRSGDLLSKGELMAAAWPDIYVHESNLKVNMSSLRRSLDDTGTQTHRYIATVAGRGYRFVAPVEAIISDVEFKGTSSDVSTVQGLPPDHDVVGRDGEIAQLVDKLRNGQSITLVGAGGVGKTTVAVAAAHALGAEYADGTCFVDLSAIDDTAFVNAAIVAALQIDGDPGETLGAVVDYLKQRRMLVVLDNCEHVLAAAAMFAGRLATSGGVCRIIATSREPLGTPNEHVFWLNSLECPDPNAIVSAAEAGQYPAVQLFARRAEDWGGYKMVETDCLTIAQICRSLNGLPLAIELAAGKLEGHTPHELLAMLDEHPVFSHQPARAVPSRHETLLATIDWSFRLLPVTDADVFRLVSLFAGAFELDDALAIGIGAGLNPTIVTVALGSLVSKSLVAAEVDGFGLRYRLLDSTRRYAVERRREAFSEAWTRDLHARRVVDLFEQSEAEWDWRETGDWAGRYRIRLPDLRFALSWAAGEDGNPELAVRLTAAAIPVWFEASLIAEAQSCVEAALKLTETVECDALVKVKLASFSAWSMIHARILSPETEDAWVLALSLADGLGNVRYRLRGLLGLSCYLILAGRPSGAIARLDEFRQLTELHQDWSTAPDGERFLALARACTGELRESRKALDHLAALCPCPDRRSRMPGFQVDRYIGIRCYLPFVAWLGGQPDYAAATARDAVDVAGSLGHLLSQSNALALAALPISLWNGDLAALRHYSSLLASNHEAERAGIWLPVANFFAAAYSDLRGEQRAVQDLRKAIDDIIASRLRLHIGMYLGFRATSLVRQGFLAEADSTIERALQYQSLHNEAWCRPELQRIKALILNQAGEYSDADRLLRSALDDAHAMGAALVRAADRERLGRPLYRNGSQEDANRVLQPVYQKYNEGFATQDLQVASKLIKQTNADLQGAEA